MLVSHVAVNVGNLIELYVAGQYGQTPDATSRHPDGLASVGNVLTKSWKKA